MASFSIHLAIGKRYMDKNKGEIIDKHAFYDGIIAPDITDNKIATHYSLPYVERWQTNVEGKVFLPEYLTHGTYDGSDYEKGVFLHLVTDYIFFCHLLDKNYLDGITLFEFCNDLYHSYDIVSNAIDTKYEIDYSNIREKINENIAKGMKSKNVDLKNEKSKNILNVKQLDEFIEYVSNLKIDAYIEKILLAGTNVLPDEDYL